MITRHRPRRRWVMRLRDGDGQLHWLVVAVPTGTGKITFTIGRARIVVEPEELARLRSIALHAVAVAVEDRDRW